MKLTICLILGAVAAMNTAAGQWIVAHRGASHAAPENTLAAFNLAWEEGADGAEGDFYLSADGRLVCIHDKDTKRTSGKKLVVAESTLAELKQLDVGIWKDPKYAGERIPTLTEVLESIPEGKRFFIELKTGPDIIAPLKKVLSVTNVPREMLAIIAFDPATVRASKQAMPDIRAHWLTGYRQTNGSWSPNIEDIGEILGVSGADGLGSQAKQSVFDSDFIEALKGQGLREFHVWTVDDPQLARYYLKQGALGITTNRPAYIRKELGLHKSK